MSQFLKSANARGTGFLSDETGGGSVFSLFAMFLLILVGGLSVDATNAWRHRQLLQLTADISSHAGAVALANGQSDSAARTAAIDAVQYNMPTSIFGSVFEDVGTDVVMINYDPETNVASSTGKKNAVAVFLHRTSLSGNPVKTLMLNAVNFISSNSRDRTEFDVNTASIAVLAATQACSSSDGFYSRGQVNITSSNNFGAGYCVHSQADIWMPQQNVFAASVGLSMPDLEDCGTKCTDAQNPGSGAAAFETNLILQDLQALILGAEQAFTDLFGTYDVKDEFFAGKTIESSALPALEAVGITTAGLTTGSVVSMSQSVFQSLTDIPGGLVYDVSCSAMGNGPNTRLTFDASNGGDDLQDVAVITNCGLEFGSVANVTSSLLLSTRVSESATITASSGSHVGEVSGGSCNTGDKTFIMGLSDMQVPADFVGTNVALIIDGDVHLSASSSSSTLAHAGLSIHSTGQIHISANHVFHSCSAPGSGLMPELLVIRYVVPETPVSTN